MPKIFKFSRKFKKNYKKRSLAAKQPSNKRYRRAASVNRSSVTLGKGFPKKLTFTHVYGDIIQATSTTGVVSTLNFACNALYDPDIGGTGHQPFNFDQIAALYDHYVVIGSKCELEIVPTAANLVAMKIGLFVNDDSTPVSTNPGSFIELVGAKMRVIPPSFNETIRLSSSWSAKKTFGGAVLANVDLQGTATSNPTELSHYFFGLQAVDTITTCSVFVKVKLTYTAVWKELKDVGVS